MGPGEEGREDGERICEGRHDVTEEVCAESAVTEAIEERCTEAGRKEVGKEAAPSR